MQRLPMRAALAAVFALAAAPALAQTPAEPHGPGVETAKTPKPVTGEDVYRYVCQACHMADAKGATGAATIPALSANPRLAAPAYPISLVVHGRGAMPGLTDVLTPAQIAAVVGYVRTHFGNSYAAPVTTAEVLKAEGKAP